jgi:hypothetical protein
MKQDQLECVNILTTEPTASWKVPALEHYQQGVLTNKPELAKTKALFEARHTQVEICGILEKSRSTVSR